MGAEGAVRNVWGDYPRQGLIGSELLCVPGLVERSVSSCIGVVALYWLVVRRSTRTGAGAAPSCIGCWSWVGIGNGAADWITWFMGRWVLGARYMLGMPGS